MNKKPICLLIVLILISGCVSFSDLYPYSKITDTPIAANLSIDLTKREIIKSWGKPHRINTNVSSYREFEEWVYGPYCDDKWCYAGERHLYFLDNKLIGWMD